MTSLRLREAFMSTEHPVSLLAFYSAALVILCVISDRVCLAVSQNSMLVRAVADSATHGAVGAVSWAVVLTPVTSRMIWQCVVCGLLASVIDLDHFVLAGSLQLKDALSLPHRPPFHATTIVLLLTSLLWVASLVLQWPQLKRVALVCFVAWTTHHLRDANRRGLWFPPVGSTPPLPYIFYIACTVIVALTAHFVSSCCIAQQADPVTTGSQLSEVLSA